MAEITFAVSPNVAAPEAKPAVEHEKLLRQAFRRPIEALWKPAYPLVSCNEDHALVNAVHDAFFGHHPLRLSPDTVWLTLARGFALHVNLHAEELRHRFVRHTGKEKLVVMRPDFFPGQENPWPEVFAAFSEQVAQYVGVLRDFIVCDFSTTGPVERAVSELMVMDTFQAYFEYEMFAGCGIPAITLLGTVEDWKSIRTRAALFGEFGLESWSRALDPILAQFVSAAEGKPDPKFWQSIFRYQSGSGPSVMTGWMTALFPYLKDEDDRLTQNPYLSDWERLLDLYDQQVGWRGRVSHPQRIGLSSIPACLASAPVKVHWGQTEVEMRFVGGLIGVSQSPGDLALQTECGWAIIYEEPVDELSPQYAWLEERK